MLITKRETQEVVTVLYRTPEKLVSSWCHFQIMTFNKLWFLSIIVSLLLKTPNYLRQVYWHMWEVFWVIFFTDVLVSSEAYSEHCQTSKVELLAKMVDRWMAPPIFAKKICLNCLRRFWICIALKFFGEK